MTITLLLADDHALARSGLRAMLGVHDDIEVVGEAADGAEAVELAAKLKPDVVLMDVRMPRMDGIEATRRIVESGAAASVLVLTTFDLDEYVFQALRAGAAGFLLKDAPPSQLAEAVRTVSRGEALLAPAVTKRLIDRFLKRGAPADSGKPAALSELTDRELEVLGMVAKGKSNAEVANELYLSEATVKTHVTRVLSKLGLRDRVQAVVFAYEVGLVEPGAN